MSQTGNEYPRTLLLSAVLLVLLAGVPASKPVIGAGEYLGDHAVVHGMPATIFNGQMPSVAGIGTAGWERAGEWLRELAVSRRRLCRLNGRSQWCDLFIERYATRVRNGGTTAPAGTGDFAAASGACRT